MESLCMFLSIFVYRMCSFLFSTNALILFLLLFVGLKNVLFAKVSLCGAMICSSLTFIWPPGWAQIPFQSPSLRRYGEYEEEYTCIGNGHAAVNALLTPINWSTFGIRGHSRSAPRVLQPKKKHTQIYSHRIYQMMSRCEWMKHGLDGQKWQFAIKMLFGQHASNSLE